MGGGERGRGWERADETHLANALADPWAVMVKFADAVVADRAVGSSWGPVQVAGGAPLGVHCEAIHLVLLGGCPRPAGPADHEMSSLSLLGMLGDRSMDSKQPHFLTFANTTAVLTIHPGAPR